MARQGRERSFALEHIAINHAQSEPATSYERPAWLDPWLENPNRLVSLWDIVNHFNVYRLAHLLRRLTIYHISAVRIRERGEGDTAISPDRFQNVIARLNELKEFCGTSNLPDSTWKTDLSLIALGTDPAQINASLVEAEIRNVIESVETECGKSRFLQVRADRAVYLDNPVPGGQQVVDALPSAATDLREAGNCLAVECHIAAVYHSMCAVEIALRALAWDRRLVFPKGPIELRQWGEILGELRKSVGQINNWPKTLIREAALYFYNKALIQCDEFNDAYRRHIAHSRAHHYSREEALAVLQRVTAFMEHLSTKISEKKRTPLVWRHA